MIAGVVSVVLITRIVRRMLRSNLFGAIAGVLLALDGLSLVLSRTALLDIFLQTFVLAGFGALVVDRDQMRARLAGLIADGADLSAGAPTLGPRPVAARRRRHVRRRVRGEVVGAVVLRGLFVLLSLVWDRAALKSAGVQRPTANVLRRSLLPASGSLLAAPMAAYLLSYLGWFTGENSWGRHYADTHSASTHLNLPLGMHLPFTWGWVPGPIRSLGSYTLNAYRFHEGLASGHPYESSQWSWLVLGRPVDFSYNGSETTCGASSCSREILLIGTPLMWWAFVPALLWLAWHWFTTRDWRAGAVWVAFVAGWFVWFPDAKRTKFLFYMAPLGPVPDHRGDARAGRHARPGAAAHRRSPSATGTASAADTGAWRGSAAYLGLVVVDFAWMWPIFTGGLLTYDSWHAHMWLPSWV